ncbi:unnamed protein product [Pleuronectes platessa]|uniref:Uncharacterized protein n=1 Tax=Pleuronectes platessa TaxID=8262 RepID=A0A9N7Z7X9_PLEPL|nr:unnamed protein product [Pleuronectes platessa]
MSNLTLPAPLHSSAVSQQGRCCRKPLYQIVTMTGNDPPRLRDGSGPDDAGQPETEGSHLSHSQGKCCGQDPENCCITHVHQALSFADLLTTPEVLLNVGQRGHCGAEVAESGSHVHRLATADPILLCYPPYFFFLQHSGQTIRSAHCMQVLS